MTPRRRAAVSALALAVALAIALPLASVLVAPHAVFIDDRTRTAQVYLVNTSSAPEEVEIGLSYGYPATDSAGNIFVRLVETPEPGNRSAAAWLRVFPRRITLQAGERQVVRVLAQPPAGLADGEYWSRMIITSRAVAQNAAEADSMIAVGVSMELRTIISVTYRKGRLETAARLTDFRAMIEGDSIIAWVGMARDGNAAFLGTLRLALRDANERAHAEWDTPIAVYEPWLRRIAVPLDGTPAGAYTLHLRVDTERTDITPASLILPAPVIERSLGVEISP